MKQSDINEIFVSTSPHISSGVRPWHLMGAVIIALLPLCIYGIYLFGISALAVILTSVISCVVFEGLFQKINKLPVRLGDLSAIVSGLMLSMVLPPTIPLWQVVLAGFFAMVVAKGFFGGIGSNVFNPALTGRAFLFVSFSKAMGTFTAPFDAVTSATVLSVIKKGEFDVADKAQWLKMFLGLQGGCIGETCALLILIGFVFLLVTKVIDARATITFVATVFVASVIAGAVTGVNPLSNGLVAVLSGGLLFGAVFMATDYATTPVTKKGRLVFGFGCGLITFLIRQFGSYPEGVMFSILIMNAIAPFLNNLIERQYGYGKKAKRPAILAQEATK